LFPLNFRWPPRWPPRHWIIGNDPRETKYFAKELEKLGVDYLHVTSGFGFINPAESPGQFPVPQVLKLYNSNRHLSFKAAFRATIANLFPKLLLKLVFGFGWSLKKLGKNAEFADEIRKVVKLPLIVNGGFQSRQLIEATLARGNCQAVSMARPL